MHKVSKPDKCVSVDILYSPTPGFIAQMTVHLTKIRYRYAIIYVDYYSGRNYIFLQQSPDVGETLQGKLAFEMHAKQHGTQVMAYHADNGVFRANQWVDDCITKQQQLTFAGVNAHHQNGKAERRIRLL